MNDLIEQEMCILVAPDGSPQPMTLATDFPSCLAQLKLMHKAGLGRSPHELFFKRYKILPVKVSIVQNGTEEDAFQVAKRRANNG